MDRNKSINTIIGQEQLGKGTQGDKLRELLVSIKALVGCENSSQQSGTSQRKESSLHKQIHLQMKINKTLLKYEIAMKWLVGALCSNYAKDIHFLVFICK